MNTKIIETVIKLLESTITMRHESNSEAKKADGVVEACIEILKTINNDETEKSFKIHYKGKFITNDDRTVTYVEEDDNEEKKAIEFPFPSDTYTGDDPNAPKTTC